MGELWGGMDLSLSPELHGLRKEMPWVGLNSSSYAFQFVFRSVLYFSAVIFHLESTALLKVFSGVGHCLYQFFSEGPQAGVSYCTVLLMSLIKQVREKL